MFQGVSRADGKRHPEFNFATEKHQSCPQQLWKWKKVSTPSKQGVFQDIMGMFIQFKIIFDNLRTFAVLVLRQFHTCLKESRLLWLLLTLFSFLILFTSPLPTIPFIVFMSPVVLCLVFWDPLSLTRVICLTMGLELFTGAWWAPQWELNESQWLPLPRAHQYPIVFQQAGGQNVDNSTSRDWEQTFWELDTANLAKPFCAEH